MNRAGEAVDVAAGVAPIAAISLTGDTYRDNFVTAVLSAEGVIYTCGAGLSGQLGRPANSS